MLNTPSLLLCGDWLHEHLNSGCLLLVRFMTLKPGDIILTGTPCGVGVFRKPPEFLKVNEFECFPFHLLLHYLHKDKKSAEALFNVIRHYFMWSIHGRCLTIRQNPSHSYRCVYVSTNSLPIFKIYYLDFACFHDCFCSKAQSAQTINIDNPMYYMHWIKHRLDTFSGPKVFFPS